MMWAGEITIYNRPGWKEFASELYDMSRDTYFLWRDSGSPRQGVLFDMKNRATARFKGAMRFIRKNEDALRKDSLAKKLLSKNDKQFWKEIRLMNNSKMSLPNVIDDVTGSDAIVEMWKSHYSDLFNCLRSVKDANDLHANVLYDTDIEISRPQIVSAISDLANSKSSGLDDVTAEHLKHCSGLDGVTAEHLKHCSGLDGVTAEHLKHCSDRIVTMLAMYFTALFIHGILPSSMIAVVIVPIVKNKRLSICHDLWSWIWVHFDYFIISRFLYTKIICTF